MATRTLAEFGKKKLGVNGGVNMLLHYKRKKREERRWEGVTRKIR